MYGSIILLTRANAAIDLTIVKEDAYGMGRTAE